MTTPIILCADDYALTPGISRGIRELARAGRLSATSAMTVSPYWEAEGHLLKTGETDGADSVARGTALSFPVGLHFTLTDYKPLTNMYDLAPDGRLPGLGPLLGRALRKKLDPDEIAAELTAQIDRFEAVMGMPPAYIDGHHHVHQLPIIRDVVIEITKEQLGPTTFVRTCNESLLGIVRRGIAVPRAALISVLGRAFARQARRQGLRGNRGFRGVRNFDPNENVAQLYDSYLTRPEPKMMIMCHPGFDEPVPDIVDEIHARRPEEFAFLASDAFAQLMKERDVELVPFSAAALPV
jgi:predicted glycoside hydrolase/deacetylase ChbG (UPF0249 family)